MSSSFSTRAQICLPHVVRLSAARCARTRISSCSRRSGEHTCGRPARTVCQHRVVRRVPAALRVLQLPAAAALPPPRMVVHGRGGSLHIKKRKTKKRN